jgi:hypothetical protein
VRHTASTRQGCTRQVRNGPNLSDGVSTCKPQCARLAHGLLPRVADAAQNAGHHQATRKKGGSPRQRPPWTSNEGDMQHLSCTSTRLGSIAAQTSSRQAICGLQHCDRPGHGAMATPGYTPLLVPKGLSKELQHTPAWPSGHPQTQALSPKPQRGAHRVSEDGCSTQCHVPHICSRLRQSVSRASGDAHTRMQVVV